MTSLDLENIKPISGDALRDEAGKLLSFRYGPPKRELMIDGKKVDLCFEYSDHGKRRLLIVESKDHAGKLDHGEINAIITDYSGIIRHRRSAELLIVTRNGLSSGAQSLIERTDEASHQSIWELQNAALGLTEYVRNHATRTFEEDRLKEYYIPAKANAVEYDSQQSRLVVASSTDLLVTVLKWIGGADSRPLAILGGYGDGKTSFAKQLASIQATAALANPLERMPVLIKLGSLAQHASIEGLLGGMFTHDFPVPNFNVHHFLDMNRLGRLLIILDGFDEMKHAMSIADFRAQAKTLNKFVTGNARVILLGRPNAFLSHDEHLHVLRGLSRYDEMYRTIPGWPQFIEFDLAPFTQEERGQFVARYLRAHTNDDDDWIGERVAEVNSLADIEPELFRKPVHAKILTDLATDRNVDLAPLQKSLSRWGLYSTFFQHIIERDLEKNARQAIGADIRRKFLRELAFWLWSQRGGSVSFNAEELPNNLLHEVGVGDAVDSEGLKREYLSGAFLERKGDDIFYFGHRSFAEFLVAERLIKVSPRGIDHAKYASVLTDGVRAFLLEAPNKEPVAEWVQTLPDAEGDIYLDYVQFIADACGGTDAFKQRLTGQSTLQRAVSVFAGSFEFAEQNLIRIQAALRNPDNAEFVFFLNLLQLHAPHFPRFRFEVAVAAALLDRVFRNAEYDQNSNKVIVPVESAPCKRLAAATLPEFRDEVTGKRVVFHGPGVASPNITDHRIKFNLLPREAHTVRGLSNDYAIPWLDVLGEMKIDKARAIAEAYFKRGDNWSGVVVREFKSMSRSVQSRSNSRKGRP